MAIDIRAAVLEDVPELARLHAEVLRETYNGILTQAKASDETRQAQWRGQLERADATNFVLVAEDDQKQIAGFAAGRQPKPSVKTLFPEYHGELDKIYLWSQYQKQGVGRRLVARVAEQFARAGILSLLVMTHPKNTARQFYERLGAQKIWEDDGNVVYGWADLTPLLENKDK